MRDPPLLFIAPPAKIIGGDHAFNLLCRALAIYFPILFFKSFGPSNHAAFNWVVVKSMCCAQRNNIKTYTVYVSGIKLLSKLDTHNTG